MRVAVFGATGTIGNALLPCSLRGMTSWPCRGGPTEATASPGRSPTQRTGAPYAVPSSGVEVAYYLVHSLGASDFEERDLQAARTVAQAAEQEGVRQLVYLGGLGDDSPNLSPHLRSRLETANQLATGSGPRDYPPRCDRRRARKRGLRDDRRARRPPAGHGLSAMGRSAYSADRAHRRRPIPRRRLRRREAMGESFDVGGPEVMTYREMIERIAALRRKRRLIVEIPALASSAPIVVLAAPRHAGQGISRAPVDRGPGTRRSRQTIESANLVQFELTPFDDAASAALGEVGA